MLARRHGLTRIEAQDVGLNGTTLHRWQIQDGRSVADVIRALEADAGIRVAQPNYRFTLQQSQFNPAAAQYAAAKLRLPEAHRLATGGRVLIAVIDSGIDAAHPELAGVIAGRFDATERSEPPSYHGTGMAGAIVAHDRLTGVAPTARILAIRAFSSNGGGEESTTVSILRSIDWAVANGARVINMSFAGPPDPEIALSLAAAARKGIVLVAAAGNAGPKSTPLYPAADPNVIAVTATDFNDRLFTQSNRGRHIAVAAPGVDIIVPAPSGTYQNVDRDVGCSRASQRNRSTAARCQARPDAAGRPQDPARNCKRPGSEGARRSIRCRACRRLPRRPVPHGEPRRAPMANAAR